VALSPVEKDVLRDLQASPRRIARGREIVAEGRRYDNVSILLDGIALRYRG